MISDGHKSRWVMVLLAVYLLMTVVLPWALYPNLPLDTIEAIGWGDQWQWGYDKHPYLSAWVAALAAWVSHPSPWALYALSAICVIVAGLYVYRSVRDLRGPLLAQMALCLSASVYLFSTTTLEFNVNVLLLPLVAALMHYAPRALRDQRWRDWVGLSLAFALGMVTKYTMVIYALPVLCWLLLTKAGRRSFSAWGLYLGLMVMLVIAVPHLLWLCYHHFETITYAMHRGDMVSGVMANWSSWLRHLTAPVYLLLAALLPLLPALLLFRFGLKGRFHCQLGLAWEDAWHRYAWLLPLAVMCVMALSGIRVRSAYLLPWLVWIGPYLIIGFPVDTVHHRRVFGITLFLISLYAIAFAFAQWMQFHRRPEKISRAFFMGPELAQTANKVWHDAVPNLPLTYVVGARWYAGNIAFYSKPSPLPLYTLESAQRERAEWMHQGVLLVIAPGQSLIQARLQWGDVLQPLRASMPRTTLIQRGPAKLKVTWVVFRP